MSPRAKTVTVPAVVLAVILAVGAGGVWYTQLMGARARAERDSEVGHLSRARQQLQRSDEERNVIIRYQPAFQRLEQMGFVGPEKRIEWLDALREANQSLKLFGVDYSIGAQQPTKAAVDGGPFQIMESTMRLRLPLLHEGDLSQLFSTLDARQTGLFAVRECALTRARSGDFRPRFEPNLMAECEIAWLTINVRQPSAESAP